MKMKTRLLLLIPLLCLLLNGCIAVAVTAIGGAAIIERKAIRNHFKQRDIAFSINNTIFGNKQLYGNNHIVVTTNNGEVLLVGQVRNQHYRQEVINIVKNTDGVTKIYDQLKITQPTSISERTQDTAISAQISSYLSNHIHAKIIVTTENRVVYLMGTVTREQSEMATKYARTTNGVKQVVKIFNYTV